MSFQPLEELFIDFRHCLLNKRRRKLMAIGRGLCLQNTMILSHVLNISEREMDRKKLHFLLSRSFFRWKAQINHLCVSWYDLWENIRHNFPSVRYQWPLVVTKRLLYHSYLNKSTDMRKSTDFKFFLLI